jgi:hypothetical protein
MRRPYHDQDQPCLPYLLSDSGIFVIARNYSGAPAAYFSMKASISS